MFKKTSKGFWELPKLTQQKGLLHGFSSIELGNMSFQYSDRWSVLTNREKFIQRLVGQEVPLVSLRQTHSTKVIVINQRELKFAITNPEATEGDGLITQLKNVCLMIKTADCLPIIIYDPKNQAVALVHAGWEGVVGKIFYQAIILMNKKYNTKICDLLVGIGPSICQNCYTIKAGEIYQQLPEWKRFLKKKREIVFPDLVGFTVDALKKIGINGKNIEIADICTKENKEFFSHRLSPEERKPEARFATIVCLI